MLKTKFATSAVMTLVFSSLLSSAVFAEETLPFTRYTEGAVIYGSGDNTTFDFKLHVSDISGGNPNDTITIWVETYDDATGENIVDKMELPIIYVPSGTAFQVEYPDKGYTVEDFYSTKITADAPPSYFTADYVIDDYDIFISDSENDARLFDANKNSVDSNGYLQYSVKEYINEDMPFLLFVGGISPDTTSEDGAIYEETFCFFMLDEDATPVNRTNYTFKNFDVTNSATPKEPTELYNSSKSFIKPQVIKGKSYLPLRALCEDILGGSVVYHQDTDLVEVKVDGKTLYFGEKTNKTNVPIESNFVTLKGKSYLPVRAVSEAFGLTVDYNSSNGNIKILK